MSSVLERCLEFAVSVEREVDAPACAVWQKYLDIDSHAKYIGYGIIICLSGAVCLFLMQNAHQVVLPPLCLKPAAVFIQTNESIPPKKATQFI